MAETLIDNNDCHNAPFSNKKLWQVVTKFMKGTEEEESNTNNETMYSFFNSPVTTNTQRKKANIPNERRIGSDILAETIKGIQKIDASFKNQRLCI